MPLLDAHGIFALGLTLFALVLFTRERIPLEGSALVVLIILALTLQLFPYRGTGGQLDPADVFAGFGNEALITVVALLICCRGLEATGALQPFAHYLSLVWRRRPQLAFLATLVLVATLSMFINNTPVVAMMLPLLAGVCQRAGVPASGVLMPVGFATIVGGMATTIGTSTNLLVVGVAADLGMRRLGMFDFTGIVLGAAAFAILFLWLVAPRLLPLRDSPLVDVSTRIFHAVLHLTPGSFPAGRSLAETRARTGNRIQVTRIERGAGRSVALSAEALLRGEDRLHVRDTPVRLKEYERLLGTPLSEAAAGPNGNGTPDAEQLAEIVVTRGSPLFGRRPRVASVLAQFGLSPVAVHRTGHGLAADPSDPLNVRLRDGDIVLVQGVSDRIQELKRLGDMLVVDGGAELPRTRRAPRAGAIMLAVVVTAAFGILPISLAALTGAGLMLVSGCLTWRQLRESLDRRLILIIVASLALGRALTVTGGTRYLAELFVQLAEPLPLTATLSGFMLVMALITEVVTNNAAAVLGTPIALSIAERLGANPEPFVLSVLFGANMSYLTPIGYQTNLLVLSAGGYRFSDFLRVGIPLQLIMWLALSVLLVLRYDI